MPKFLAACHYNEEDFSQHLKKKNTGYWLVQSNGNKFATGQILRKLVEVVKGRILAKLSSKVSRTVASGTEKRHREGRG